MSSTPPLCQCIKGFTKPQSSAFCVDSCTLLLDTHSYYDSTSDSCICNTNFGYDSTQLKCVRCTTLGANWVSDPTGNCTCRRNYLHVSDSTPNGSCVACATAQNPNLISDGNDGCICKNHYFR